MIINGGYSLTWKGETHDLSCSGSSLGSKSCLPCAYEDPPRPRGSKTEAFSMFRDQMNCSGDWSPLSKRAVAVGRFPTCSGSQPHLVPYPHPLPLLDLPLLRQLLSCYLEIKHQNRRKIQLCMLQGQEKGNCLENEAGHVDV